MNLRKLLSYSLVVLACLGSWSFVPQAQAQRENCDPAYPTVCIPPPPPDLDCKDISYRNFQVLQPDPHKFDRDRDGIGCEPRNH